MNEDLSPIALARQASALTIGDLARVIGTSIDAYQQLEARPLHMNLGELRAVCSELNSDGRTIMREWLDSFFGL